MEFKIIEKKKKKVKGWNLSNIERVWILNIAIISMLIQITGIMLFTDISTFSTGVCLILVVTLCCFVAANNGWWKE